MNKYGFFALIVLLAVSADLLTKKRAEDELASITRRWNHPIEVIVEAEGPTTVGEFVDVRFGPEARQADPPQVRGYHVINAFGEELGPLPDSYQVNDGDVLRVDYRRVEVVPGFWNHVYVQNYGAAWGFLSDRDERFVRPFFLAISVIAVVIVLGIFRNVRPDQRLLIWALSLIVGGAFGNFVDRVRYGYVVDFIDWYLAWGGAEHHWPTFNVADIAITVGVGLMVIEILTSKDPEEQPESAASESDAVTVAKEVDELVPPTEAAPAS